MRRDNLAKTGYLDLAITVLRGRTQEGGWRWMGVPSVKILIKKIPTMIVTSAANRSIGSTTGCTITEKAPTRAPTRAFSWLKAATTTFDFHINI